MLTFLLSCTASAPAGPPAPTSQFITVTVADLKGVTALTSRGDEMYAAAQEGTVWRLGAPGTAPVAVAKLADRLVSGGERGLLGLAFRGERAYVNYTYEAADTKSRTGRGLYTRVSSFPIVQGSFDTSAEQEILSFRQPWANHNGGALAFGPDGMLYIGVGDGGSGGDPRTTGQDPSDWLGSILRVDVSTAPYAVPTDNPFLGRPGFAPEVWAYGIRNPWGMHFDGDTLYFADVGQDAWEEVNRGVAGANYGWNVTEGTHCFSTPDCSAGGLTAPLAEYGRDQGRSVTGGIVYRGPAIKALDGRYLYADFVTGRLWGLPITDERAVPVMIGDTGLMPAAMGQDSQGRLYIADYKGGVLRVDPPV